MRNVQHRFRRSELELRGSRNGLKTSPWCSSGTRPVLPSVQIPKPPAKAGLEGPEGAQSLTREPKSA
eukprot:6965399-Alexandrium_andersonii.AAC.1